MDYVLPLLAFLATYVAVTVPTWDARGHGLGRLTRTGRLTLAVAVGVLVASLWSVYASHRDTSERNDDARDAIAQLGIDVTRATFESYVDAINLTEQHLGTEAAVSTLQHKLSELGNRLGSLLARYPGALDQPTRRQADQLQRILLNNADEMYDINSTSHYLYKLTQPLNAVMESVCPRTHSHCQGYGDLDNPYDHARIQESLDRRRNRK